MLHHKVPLFVAAMALAVGLVGAKTPPPSQIAPAQKAEPTPGQLEIVDKVGKHVGLCPLSHTDVVTDIAGYVARVTVTQQFRNPSNTPIEAVYTFPLPNDAAVDDMTMTIGTRVIKGQIKRKEEARQVYEAAKANGQAAALLDQERPNVFTQSVANIMPGDRVNITISYVNLLKYQDGIYEFNFPMVVGPRFLGGATPYKVETDPGATPVLTDAQKIAPPITPKGTRAGHDISMTVNLDAGIPLTDVRSMLHPVTIQKAGQNRAVIRLRNQQEIPNRDFILRYTAAGSQVQEGMLCYAPPGAKTGYFTMVIQPPMAPAQDQISPKEMVFVIDQTGSQSGWPIEKAKETMKYCISQMNPGDTFQLIGFNTDVYPCFPAPVPNTPDNVQKALAFLAPLQGAGGTDILKSVDYALKIPDDPDRLRIICYMTDGYVGNDMQIVQYVQKNRGRARMFPFGVGNSVNRFLIDGMAKEGRGAAEYVAVNTNQGAQYGGPMPQSGVKDAKDVAERFYHRIASPMLLDINVDWNGMPVEDIYPKQIPDLFSSGPIIIKGRYSHPGQGTINVRGLLRGKPWSRNINVTFPQVKNDGSAIATLWARERIEDLQSQDWIGAQTGSPKKEITDQIINTALEYRLMSQYTSFVAVEERVVNLGGKQRTLDVPVELADGVSDAAIRGEALAKKTESLSTFGRTARGRSLGRDGSVNHFYAMPAAPAQASAAGATVLSLGVPAPKPSAGSDLKQRIDNMPTVHGGAWMGTRSDRVNGGYVDKDGRPFGTGKAPSQPKTKAPVGANGQAAGDSTVRQLAQGVATAGGAKPGQQPATTYRREAGGVAGGGFGGQTGGAAEAKAKPPTRTSGSAAGGAKLDGTLTSNNYKNYHGGNVAVQFGQAGRGETESRLKARAALGDARRLSESFEKERVGKDELSERAPQWGFINGVTDKEVKLLRDIDALIEEKPADAAKQLAALKPQTRKSYLEARKTSLRQAKLAQTFLDLLTKSKIENQKSKILEVQVWTDALPADGLKKLAALGFKLAATLTPNRLLIGTVTADKLDALIELPWVQRVEPPKFK